MIIKATIRILSNHMQKENEEKKSKQDLFCDNLFPFLSNLRRHIFGGDQELQIEVLCSRATSY